MLEATRPVSNSGWSGEAFGAGEIPGTTVPAEVKQWTTQPASAAP